MSAGLYRCRKSFQLNTELVGVGVFSRLGGGHKGAKYLLHRSYAVPEVKFDIEVMWHITSHRLRVVVQSVLVRVSSGGYG